MIRSLFLAASLVVLGGCQATTGHSEPAPALLTNADQEQVRAEIKTRIATALGADTMLSATALTESYIVAIEPRSRASLQNQGIEGRWMEGPDHFELYRHGEACILRHRQSEKEWTLEYAECEVIVE
ncbi:MAG TPA: hypothetical protein VIC08_10935 [Cellvibrionaceae bacterium]